MPNKTFILGLCGAQLAGKSTSADILCKEFPNFYKKYSLADELKTEATVQNVQGLSAIDFGWNPLTLEWTGPKSPEGRKYLQELGQQSRLDNNLYWYNKVKVKINKDQPQCAVIDDCRYVMELEQIYKDGGVVSLISNKHQEFNFNVQICEDISHLHISELEWRLWVLSELGKSKSLMDLNNRFYVVPNNGTLENLKHKLMALDYHLFRTHIIK